MICDVMKTLREV